MNKEKEVKNIYVDLDSLFDTRLGMLYMLDSTLANEIYNTTYDERFTNEFGYLPINVFETYYRLRNKNILLVSPPTKVLKLITEIRHKIDTDPKYTDKNITLYVNSYPYNLTKEEEDNIAKMILYYLKYTNVEIINKSPLDLNPSIIVSSVETLIMYNGLEWLNIHTANGELVDNPLMDKLMYIPALLTNNQSGKNHDELFQILSEQLSFFINIVPTDIKLFNSIRYIK